MKPRKLRRILARFTWDHLKVSFWFIPLVMSFGAYLLVQVMYWVDTQLPPAIQEYNPFFLSTKASEQRAMLITLATNIMATAGVVFSLLTLPLSSVANQYGSRLLRVFLADRTTQTVLGMYAGTFVYCITAAFSIPKDTEVHPYQLMASMAFILMLITTASLILLIQHISTMLQAPNIAAAAGAELREGIRTGKFETTWHGDGSQPASGMLEPLPGTARVPICVKHTGYIQYIDLDYLSAFAREKDLIIHLVCRPGQFIWQGEVVTHVWLSGEADRQLDRQIRRAFQIGDQREPTQDIEYAINQLVEMAVRAMSSGGSDPFTVMTCLDHLGNNLAEFVRQGEIGMHTDEWDGRIRFIAEPVTFAKLLGAAFDMIRHVSRDNACVLLHHLKVIESIRKETKSPANHQELLRHVNLILAESRRGTLIEQDLQAIQRRCDVLQTMLTETSTAQVP